MNEDQNVEPDVGEPDTVVLQVRYLRALDPSLQHTVQRIIDICAGMAAMEDQIVAENKPKTDNKPEKVV